MLLFSRKIDSGMWHLSPLTRPAPPTQQSPDDPWLLKSLTILSCILQFKTIIGLVHQLALKKQFPTDVFYIKNAFKKLPSTPQMYILSPNAHQFSVTYLKLSHYLKVVDMPSYPQFRFLVDACRYQIQEQWMFSLVTCLFPAIWIFRVPVFLCSYIVPLLCTEHTNLYETTHVPHCTTVAWK